MRYAVIILMLFNGALFGQTPVDEISYRHAYQVAHFPLDGHGESAILGQANAKLIGTTSAADEDGNANGALRFNGQDYIILPEVYDLEDRTIILKFRATEINGYPRIYSSDHDHIQHGSTRIFLSNEDEPTLRVTNWGGNLNTFQYPIQLNTWYKIAVVYTGIKIAVYLDDVKIADFEPRPYDHSIDGYESAHLGVARTRGRGHFIGEIDDLRIYTSQPNQTVKSALEYYDSELLEQLGFAEDVSVSKSKITVSTIMGKSVIPMQSFETIEEIERQIAQLKKGHYVVWRIDEQGKHNTAVLIKK